MILDLPQGAICVIAENIGNDTLVAYTDTKVMELL